jgi:hypothetical protein
MNTNKAAVASLPVLSEAMKIQKAAQPPVATLSRVTGLPTSELVSMDHSNLVKLLIDKKIMTNQGLTQVPSTVPELLAHVNDIFLNTSVISTDIVSFGSNMRQVNLTARDCILEPNYLANFAARATDYKNPVNPSIVNLEENTNTAMNQLIMSNSIPNYGWVFKLQAQSTLDGSSSVTITKKNSADVTLMSFSCELVDINKAGYACSLEFGLDTIQDATAEYTAPAQGVDGTLEWTAGSASNPADQYKVHPQVDDDDSSYWVLSGINATLTVYPILGTRQVNSIIQGLYYTGHMNRLSEVLLKSFEG